ncbi:alcohol dehydrogenase catalytic domain-containing protein [Brevibacterium casei]|uniref:alcohol dehydrogenase catalytic domain-containing protein n=1 Tax=Brevibacterium casei TaxID=33889 RepID=UPI0024684422|nr:alcohol dehydrogenase catalytic domain-containing protein [Brevibacterium casei]MDH5147973.1 alcohol dehydrogenase catalytic domain-containing protein [Brevibacterium casei]
MSDLSSPELHPAGSGATGTATRTADSDPAVSSTAEALVWLGEDRFEPRSLPIPPLAPGETLVRLTTATVCGSDRHTVAGHRPAPSPSVLGHEGVGVIAATTADHAVGQRVVFAVTAVCGDCLHCRRGLSAKCVSVAKVGHESTEAGWALSGTYASHIVLPAGVAIAAVPDTVPDAVAATAGCAVATVMAMCEAAGDLGSRRVFVNGIGMLGLIAIAAAKSRGAAEVIAFDPAPERRRLAEATGAEAGVRACLDAIGIGGTTVLAGSVSPGPHVTFDPEHIVRGWRTITGVHNYEPRHLRQAVDFLAGDGAAMPWDDILGGPIRPADLPDEFAHPTPGLRTVVDLDG